jgi:hypothetical protein
MTMMPVPAKAFSKPVATILMPMAASILRVERREGGRAGGSEGGREGGRKGARQCHQVQRGGLTRSIIGPKTWRRGNEKRTKGRRRERRERRGEQAKPDQGKEGGREGGREGGKRETYFWW